MLNFNFYMNYHLIKKGYFNITEIPSEVFENTLKEFFLESLAIKNINVDIFTLFNKYAAKVDDKKELYNIIHYLLAYISILQSFEVVWQINESKEPVFTYSNHYPDKIDALNPSKEFDYHKLFALALNTALDLKSLREEGIKR